MDDLVSWLSAQIAEDERVARAAMDPDGKATGWWWSDPASPTEAHIARWDPARVLAECAAKRAILGRHKPRRIDGRDGDGMERSARWCDCCDEEWGRSGCADVQSLAQPHATRSGFRPEWA